MELFLNESKYQLFFDILFYTIESKRFMFGFKKP